MRIFCDLFVYFVETRDDNAKPDTASSDFLVVSLYIQSLSFPYPLFDNGAF